ncbi:uncharacterized protein LOC113343966 isoform X2 [Papaver somniferum]|uniref:uncharacterized protein LOC113343966 isoform X2 n=1 Tax=Papaver somniferum TaxID=3469 RepID=UPI000E6F7EDF|nr:uncharacterized protein LOC113343966 isoform X2 [Papaver somniferum]
MGLSGGISLAWKKGVDLEIMHTSRHNFHAIIHTHSQESDFLLSCMYGSNNPLEYQEQWQYMLDMQPFVDLPWILLGDLNFTMSNSETQSSSQHPRQHSRMVRPIIQQLGLIDLGFSGSSTTWSNHRTGQDYTAVRLDRALVNVMWLNYYFMAHLMHIPHVASNHSPILLATSTEFQSCISDEENNMLLQLPSEKRSKMWCFKLSRGFHLGMMDFRLPSIKNVGLQLEPRRLSAVFRSFSSSSSTASAYSSTIQYCFRSSSDQMPQFSKWIKFNRIIGGLKRSISLDGIRTTCCFQRST